MQMVFLGDNLYEMLKSIFWEKEEYINLSSAEIVQRVEKFNCAMRYLYWNLYCALTISAPNFRLYVSSALLCFFNKLSIGNKFLCKAERLNVKQRRS